MKQPKYQRILIKLSGEALADQSGHGIDFETVKSVCEKIKDCADRGTQIAIVVGAGNFWRGRQGSDMDRAKAYHMGMLATMMNSIALGDALEKAGAQTVVFAATEMPKFGQTYTCQEARRCLEQGKIIICGGGTGNPYFTTDTAAALRAVEIEADIALFAKNIDGVYTADPKQDKTATRYARLSFTQLLSQNLKVIDAAAAALCRDNHLPVYIFDLGDGSNIARVAAGEDIGTLLDNEE